MSAGWNVEPSSEPGVRQAKRSMRAGDKKVWTISVPNRDLSGFSAAWFFGVPSNPERLNIESASYAKPRIILKKSTDAGSLALVQVAGIWRLAFTIVKAETIGLAVRPYWQQAIVYDPDGEPTTIEEGQLSIEPSFATLEAAA